MSMKLNLGCGENRIPGWSNHDRDVDLTVLPLPFPDGAATHILIEHCLEHFNSRDCYLMLEDFFRILKPKGVLRICVPDISRIIRHGTQDYVNFYVGRGWSRPIRSTAVDHEHKMLWTFETLSIILANVGFARVDQSTPRLSVHSELNGVDGHHRMLGERFNDIETLVVEAIK